MTPDYRQTALWLQDRLPAVPHVAVILGTGLNDLADSCEVLCQIPYSEIPGFVSSTAPSHRGNLILAKLEGRQVLFLQGRFHYYEGYPVSAVVFPVRTLAALGVKNLVVTNAAGSLREAFVPGSIAMLSDHINFMGVNPLIGPNDDSLGERFPSLNEPYDPEYRKICAGLAKALNIQLHEGIYIAVAGPSLETRAECAAFADWGADLVGMSTVPEVIAARHAGLRTVAFSIVTNYSNLFHAQAHSQDEIRHNAAQASGKLRCLIAGLVKILTEP